MITAHHPMQKNPILTLYDPFPSTFFLFVFRHTVFPDKYSQRKQFRTRTKKKLHCV